MKQKFLIILLLLTTIFIFTGCNNPKELTDAQKFKEEYENLNNTTREKDGKVIRNITIPEDNPFVYATASEIVEKMNNKETFIVYFGFADCPWCRSILPTLVDVAKDLKLTTIYYVDIKNIRDVLELDEEGQIKTTKKGTKEYYELLNKLTSVLEDYTLYDEEENKVNTNEKRIYAPNVVSVVNGEAKKIETGISSKQTDAYMKLTKTMKKETYNKFKCSIECILEEKTTCSNKKAC